MRGLFEEFFSEDMYGGAFVAGGEKTKEMAVARRERG